MTRLRWPVVLFDLDGTLTDPKEGITRSARHALISLGIVDDVDPDTLTGFIGPPLWESFPAFYGLSSERTRQAVAAYRERYATIGLFENRPYDGIAPLLARLHAAGARLALATSKPAVYAQRIVERFDLAPYLHVVAGAELDGARSDKAELVAYALDALGERDPARAVLVGDRARDVEGARRAGTASIAALWGYGSREELLTARPLEIAEDVAALERLLLY